MENGCVKPWELKGKQWWWCSCCPCCPCRGTCRSPRCRWSPGCRAPAPWKAWELSVDQEFPHYLFSFWPFREFLFTFTLILGQNRNNDNFTPTLCLLVNGYLWYLHIMSKNMCSIYTIYIFRKYRSIYPHPVANKATDLLIAHHVPHLIKWI